MPSISPMLMYEDPAHAVHFLCRAFGFEPIGDGDDGSGGNWLRLGDSTISVWGVWREAGYRGVAELSAVSSQLWCEIDDADRHYQQALDAGATVVGPPADLGFGFVAYRAVDLEGYRWFFGAPIGGR